MKKLLLCMMVFCLILCCACAEPETRSASNHWNIPENQKSASDFERADPFIQYPGAIQAVDVSSHQEQIDWAQVRAAGVDAAILQLDYRGYTEGDINVDPFFLENLEGARSAGLQIGVYFFSQALSVEEAEEEAAFVLETLNRAPLDLPVFYDWEEVSDGRTSGHATTQITDYALAFCRIISERGYQAGVYFNQAYGYSLLRLEELRPYTFWLAEYEDHPSFFYDVDVWQYTSSGHVDGIETRADLNLIFPPADTQADKE